MKRIIRELQRRNVFKAAISYLVVSWLVLQVGAIIFPIFQVNAAFQRWILIFLAVGFIPWIIFAYIYEWTSTGFKKTTDVAPQESIARSTNKKLNAYIIGGLSLVVVVLLSRSIFFRSM